MSGLIENLMSKMDVMIDALNENTKARLAGAGDAPAAAAAAEPAKRGRPAKAAAEPTQTAGPTTTEAELVAKFEELKGTDTEKRMPELRKIIAEVGGFASLKELRMAPAKFDVVMAALTAYEATLGATATADDDDL